MMDRPNIDQHPAGRRVPVHRPSPLNQALSASALPGSRSDDSWIELASQPSSSSLSSIADEIITDGLRVQHDPNARRRHRVRRSTIDPSHPTVQDLGRGGSSQEEYEESESESDRIMTSSNEALHPSSLAEEWQPPSGEYTLSPASSDNAYPSGTEEDDVENATAIGIPHDHQCFTPQPNIFTQPPSSRAPQQSASSYFNQRPRPSSQHHSFPARDEHSPYSVISPSYQADHDAALRASLSTLLSCAAAARGLTKSNKTGTDSRTKDGPSNRVDTATIGFAPESAVFDASNRTSTEAHPPGTTEISSTSPEKTKRKATTSSTAPRSNSKDRRAVKKARRTSSNWTPATVDEVSPTLLTWVVSAGVVVLVSAISFSAGYVVGKETGRAEMLGDFGSGVRGAGRACGRDAIKGAGRGLGRLRLADAASSIRV